MPIWKIELIGFGLLFVYTLIGGGVYVFLESQNKDTTEAGREYTAERNAWIAFAWILMPLILFGWAAALVFYFAFQAYVTLLWKAIRRIQARRAQTEIPHAEVRKP